MHKDTKGKPKLRYVPYAALVSIAKVREFGIAKYKDDTGWRTVDQDDFIEAALRHIGKYFDGETHDDESGLHHIDHAVTSLALAIGVRDEKLQEKNR